MNRMITFFRDSIQQKDWFALSMLLLMVGVILSSLSITVSSSMREAALRRFHLASSSYPVWAVHQLVPSMYNFENRVKFCNEVSEDGVFDESHPSYTAQAVNHFPARYVTFGNRRNLQFKEHRRGMLEMSSRYGKMHLVSRWEIEPDQNDVLIVKRRYEKLEIQ